MRDFCSSQQPPRQRGLGFPGASGVRVGLAALVLPSVPPVYSSASPGDFLPLCPHTLPVPALHEEMSGKCLKSSSELSDFSTGCHRATGAGWAVVPSPRRAHGTIKRCELCPYPAVLPMLGMVPCLSASVPLPLMWPE